MTKDKSPQQPIHSSTAQYLTFVSASGDDPNSMEVRYEDENIWMTQKNGRTLWGICASNTTAYCYFSRKGRNGFSNYQEILDSSKRKNNIFLL